MAFESFKKLLRLNRQSESQFTERLISRIYGAPLLASPAAVNDAIAAAMGGGILSASDADVMHKENGVALINLSGPMVSRTDDYCSPLSYEQLQNAYASAFDDDEIHTLISRFATGGGEANRAFDLSDYIYANRGTKKTIAVIDDHAQSAGYLIAAAHSEVVVSRTSEVGSIGVYRAHEDRSGLNKKLGVKVEFIYAGDSKVDGNPFEPLSDSARADMQQSVDKLYNIFTESVSKYLGVSQQKIIDTQARTFSGEEAVKAGLANRVETLEEVLTKLSGEITVAKENPETGFNTAHFQSMSKMFGEAGFAELGLTAITNAWSMERAESELTKAKELAKSALERQRADAAMSADVKNMCDAIGLDGAFISSKIDSPAEMLKAALGDKLVNDEINNVHGGSGPKQESVWASVLNKTGAK